MCIAFSTKVLQFPEVNGKARGRMSIKLGKEKNWGSRSGRSGRSPRERTIETLLSDLGVPSDILKAIADGDSEVQQAAKSLIAMRDQIYEGKGQPKEVLRTKLGHLYQGDCIKVLQSLEDNSLDCVFADPPFNLAKDYGTSENDDLKHEEYLEWTHAWLNLCVQKLKPGGALFVYNIPKWATYIASFLNTRLTFRNWIAVDIPMSMPIPRRLYPSHYALLYYIKGEKPNRFAPSRIPTETCRRCGFEQPDYGGYKMKMNPQGINLRDVWTDIPPVRHGKHKNRDANELSIKLLDRVLDIATEEGDLVFDPFGGSGTTYIVAELKKRRWIGSELGDWKPIADRLKTIAEDEANLQKIRHDLNTLFTDRALILRKKAGLPLDNYQILEEQIRRVFPEDQLELGAKKRRKPDLEM